MEIKNMETSSNDDCPICNGARFVHPLINGVVDYRQSVPCECRIKGAEERRIQRLFKMCELPPMSEDWSFDNFELYPEVKTAYEVAKEVAKNPTEIHWVTFQGNNDVGKSHLAIPLPCILVEFTCLP